MQHSILDPDILKLCYIDSRDHFAWFTSCPLPLQWGDDWDDAPYEYNAGSPYSDHKLGGERVTHQLVKIAWESEHVMPCDGHTNSPYSVRDINCGGIAWLRVPSWCSNHKLTNVFAGTSLRDFVKAIDAAGGEVYFSRSTNIYL